MTTPLDEFFRTMKPFLAGKSSAADVEARLGKSASGTARLALYPQLVRRQKRSVLDHFFRAAASASRSHDEVLWDRLIVTFLATNEPMHWEPNQFAREFVRFLGEIEESERVPSDVSELADFAWIRHYVLVSERPKEGAAGMGTSLMIRQYAHEIPDFAREAETKNAADRKAAPRAEPCTVIVSRSHLTGRVEITRPSLAALVAVGRRDGHAGAQRLPPAITEEDVAREDAALVALGVLSSPRAGAGA